MRFPFLKRKEFFSEGYLVMSFEINGKEYCAGAELYKLDETTALNETNYSPERFSRIEDLVIAQARACIRTLRKVLFNGKEWKRREEESRKDMKEQSSKGEISHEENDLHVEH